MQTSRQFFFRLIILKNQTSEKEQDTGCDTDDGWPGMIQPTEKEENHRN